MYQTTSPLFVNENPLVTHRAPPTRQQHLVCLGRGPGYVGLPRGLSGSKHTQSQAYLAAFSFKGAARDTTDPDFDRRLVLRLETQLAIEITCTGNSAEKSPIA